LGLEQIYDGFQFDSELFFQLGVLRAILILQEGVEDRGGLSPLVDEEPDGGPLEGILGQQGSALFGIPILKELSNDQLEG